MNDLINVTPQKQWPQDRYTFRNPTIWQITREFQPISQDLHKLENFAKKETNIQYKVIGICIALLALFVFYLIIKL